ncbi:DUF3842 family protein [Candidatus Oleimmundimicrobium sp.]|uniref:DUF3842 family protein n=1 Tax=Candidatus Oleimmundimicrobium sp. TaxID=3060597 RepID=UPI0027159900|nr:DUF3842 family protein [Candidatus Oleimmundimicrobium sp.]MDO8885677.1 DUF3842 family protein [Candidatus Oleimmundimicrobium sp.]
MVIAVIDGMGGSIGRQIVTRLRENLPGEVEIMILATNAIAASNMMKAGANRAASGENALSFSLKKADIVVGPISIVIPNSFMGELTPKMAESIAGCEAEKILLPLSHPHVNLIGVEQIPLPHLMEEVVKLIRKKLGLKEVKQ